MQKCNKTSCCNLHKEKKKDQICSKSYPVLNILKIILENTLISVSDSRKSWWQPRIVRLNQGPYAIQNIITHHLLHLKVPDLDRKKVIVPSHVLYRMLTGCPCPFRPMARFQACSIVPLSRDNEGTSVPLSWKVALSRPIEIATSNSKSESTAPSVYHPIPVTSYYGSIYFMASRVVSLSE